MMKEINRHIAAHVWSITWADDDPFAGDDVVIDFACGSVLTCMMNYDMAAAYQSYVI